MCIGCYEEYGAPKIVSDKTLAAADLVRVVYEHSVVGGNLHVQLDDWNIEDEFWEEFHPNGFDGETEEQLSAERRCFDAFKAMSLEERASALAICDQYFDPRTGREVEE